jgi:hypothetical protein
MFKKFSINFKFNKSINKLIFIFCLFIFSGCGLDIGKAGSWEASGYDSGDATVGDSGDNSEVNPVDFVKLSWMSPMSKADGSALTNLGGYMVYYRNTDAITQVYSMDVGNVTSATIDNLSQGTWCFAISAYNEANIESELSNYACKDI